MAYAKIRTPDKINKLAYCVYINMRVFDYSCWEESENLKSQSEREGGRTHLSISCWEVAALHFESRCTDGFIAERSVLLLNWRCISAWGLLSSLLKKAGTIRSGLASTPRLIYLILMRHLFSIKELSKHVHLFLMGCAVKLINTI